MAIGPTDEPQMMYSSLLNEKKKVVKQPPKNVGAAW